MRDDPIRRFATKPALALLRALPIVLLWLAPLADPVWAAGPLDALVGVRATVPADARTARTLGQERAGSGVVIDDSGLVLTIGYLIMESDGAEILLPGGRSVAAEVAAYDYDSGFGLLRPIAPLDIEPVTLGDSGSLEERDRVLAASFDQGVEGGSVDTTPAIVVSRRDFAGYWEYLLPDAIFTAPPHGGYGGAALFGPEGELLGIGSLFVGDAAGEEQTLPGNMFVPIDALKPIYEDLLRIGRAAGPARPWLGLFGETHRGRVFISRVAPEGPAESAGVETDDIVVAVAGESIADLHDFYRTVWALGDAGVEVPLTLLGRDGLKDLQIRSADRYDYLRLQPTY